MSAVVILPQPPADWEDGCAGSGLTLFGAAWRRVLAAGLGASFGYGLRDGRPAALGVLFRRGPFRLAYADFPAGISNPDDDLLALLADWARRSGAAALRFARDAGAPGAARELARLPVTRIADLQGWSERGHDKPARSANRARRSRLHLRAAAAADAGFVAACYAGTVQRQGGSGKYPKIYFDTLLQAAGHEARIRCQVAELDGQAVGFHCSALHGDTAFYLHGGSSGAGRDAYAADLLMLDSLRWARAQGAGRYDFLQSPAGQPGLVRYKEAWGGASQLQAACELSLAPLQHGLLRLAMTAASGLSALTRRATAAERQHEH